MQDGSKRNPYSIHTQDNFAIKFMLYLFGVFISITHLEPLLEEEAARFFRSLSLPLSFLFSLSVASESLLPVLSFRLRALNNKQARGEKNRGLKFQQISHNCRHATKLLTWLATNKFSSCTLGRKNPSFEMKTNDTPTIRREHASNGGLPEYEADVTHDGVPSQVTRSPCAKWC